MFSFSFEFKTSNNTNTNQRTIVDPLARTWCKQACTPLGVASDNPCKCISNGQAKTQVPTYASQQVAGQQVAGYNSYGTNAASPLAPGAAEARVPAASLSITKQPVANEATKPVVPGIAGAAAFPPRAPEAFPPQAPAFVKSPVPTTSQANGAKIAGAQALPTQQKAIANVAGPSASIIPPPAPSYFNPIQAAYLNQKATMAQPQYPLSNPVVASTATAAVQAPQSVKSFPTASGNNVAVNANTRHDVHPDTNQATPQTDNACTRACYPVPAIRNDPCTCASKPGVTNNATVATRMFFFNFFVLVWYFYLYKRCLKTKNLTTEKSKFSDEYDPNQFL